MAAKTAPAFLSMGESGGKDPHDEERHEDQDEGHGLLAHAPDGASQIMIWSDKTSLSVDRYQFQGPEIHQVMIKLMLRIKPEEDLSFF